jgi:hypothetical protein
VTKEQLERIAALAPEEDREAASSSKASSFDIAEYLTSHGLEVGTSGVPVEFVKNCDPKWPSFSFL